MPTDLEMMHSNSIELIGLKIPIFSGKAAENNLKILEIVALNGPLLKYGILKEMSARYSTVSRRVDDLRERGYLINAGTRKTQRGRQSEEILYGLTWKGLFAGLVNQKIRQNILQVLRNNPQLEIPSGDFSLMVLDEIYSAEDFDVITHSIIMGFIFCTSPPLDDIPNEELKLWLIPAVRAAPRAQLKNKGNMNLLTLLDNPQIFQYVKENYFPMVLDYERQIYEAYQLMRVFSKIVEFVLKLEPENKPSEKIREYLESLDGIDISELLDEKEGL